MKLLLCITLLIFISCGKEKKEYDFPKNSFDIDLFQLKSEGSFYFKQNDIDILTKNHFNYDQIYFESYLFKNYKLNQDIAGPIQILLQTPYQEVLHCFTPNERAAFKAVLTKSHENELKSHISLDTEARNLPDHNGFSVEEENLFLVNLKTLNIVSLQKNTLQSFLYDQDFFNQPVCLVLRINKFTLNSKYYSFFYSFSEDEVLSRKKTVVSKNEIPFVDTFDFMNEKISLTLDKEAFIYPSEAISIAGHFERKAILPKKKDITLNVSFDGIMSRGKAVCTGVYSYEGENTLFQDVAEEENIYLSVNDKKIKHVARAFDYREYQVLLNKKDKAINIKDIRFTSDLKVEVIEKLTYKSDRIFAKCPSNVQKKILLPTTYRLTKGTILKHFRH